MSSKVFLTLAALSLVYVAYAHSGEYVESNVIESFTSPYRSGIAPLMKDIDETRTFKKKSSHKKTIRYTPDWESLDTRPLPDWYDEAKFGIFIHWGVFSVPSFGSEWFWWNWEGAKNPNYINFMKNNYRPNFTYAEFAPKFTAEFYNASEWAEILGSSGAKYVVLTSKHHEGYTLWPSKFSWNWNSVDVGSRRDLLGELANAVRGETSLKFGLYHSLYEWFHPLYLLDKNNSFTTQYFVTTKTMPELYELVVKYKPSVVWSDGDWEPQYTYWDSTKFLAWLYNESPVKDEVVVNDRWGSGMACNHGDFYTCTDHYNPGVLQPHKWENCLTIDRHSWGFRRNAPLADYRNTFELLKELAETVSCGGNMLLNVGPTHDGKISPIFEERLRQIGSWLSINGDAIYATKPWVFQNDTLTSNVWYTSKTISGNAQPTVYAIVLFWPEDDIIRLAAPITGDQTRISFLGYDGEIQWAVVQNGTEILFPPKSQVSGDWAWVLQFDGLAN